MSFLNLMIGDTLVFCLHLEKEDRPWHKKTTQNTRLLLFYELSNYHSHSLAMTWFEYLVHYRNPTQWTNQLSKRERKGDRKTIIKSARFLDKNSFTPKSIVSKHWFYFGAVVWCGTEGICVRVKGQEIRDSETFNLP